MGYIDGVRQADGYNYLFGWACAQKNNSPITVHVYVNGPAGGGGTFITYGLANEASEPAVASACQATGTNYRFKIPVDSFTGQYPNAPIYVHGISPSGLANLVITNSGKFKIPVPTIQLFYDSFEISEWNNLWTEDANNDWLRSSQRAAQAAASNKNTGLVANIIAVFRKLSQSSTRSAEIDGPASNSTLTSIPISMQGKKNAKINFSWYIESGFDTGEYISFETSTNNGSTWTERARIKGNVDTENRWKNEEFTLTNISSLRLRFRGTVSDSDEDGNLDNVKVIGY